MIDAVIVHYASSRDLRVCLDALERNREHLETTTVVDNRAAEPTPVDVARRADVLELPRNLGFARAANLGAARGSAEHILLLNPDVKVSDGLPGELAATLAEPDVAAVAPALVLPDGSPQVGIGGRLPGWRSILAEHAPRRQRSAAMEDGRFFIGLPPPESRSPGERLEVDWLSGACLLLRRQAFERVDGFDESFFLYGEDIDLGHRLGASGYRLLLRPDVVAEHRHVAPSGASPGRAPHAAWLDGLDLYYRKHRPWSRRGLHAIATVGFAARAAAYRLRLAAPRSPRDDAVERVLAYARRSLALALTP